ncbi:hypothetical protein KIL84_011522 [Mauremys mutica]|uniref:Uncharacterized protein n=1 Tax=Mauremys mutica TaxID=74926 RepID=A0A9D3XEP6_9SAUR|nr:hypothetical protein KIL84_011522 [Mauremys mutica]
MAAGPGSERKLVQQDELRQLMREKRRQSAAKKRIEAPFAKYPFPALPGLPRSFSGLASVAPGLAPGAGTVCLAPRGPGPGPALPAGVPLSAGAGLVRAAPSPFPSRY